jgi:hypothetical protein
METMKSNVQSNRSSGMVFMQVRTLHAYLGMLIAPAVIFFAATGLIQIYSLHEQHEGYTPPPLIEKLGMVHKNQRFALGHHKPSGGERPRSAAPAAGPAHPAEAPHTDEARQPKVAIGLLKAFFALVAVGLIFSTATGVWMALCQRMRRRAYVALLLIGAVLPVILAALSA